MAIATEDLLHAIREARHAAGLSQRDVAARTGLPQGHISRIERGETDPRLTSAVQMARAAGAELVLVPRRLLPAVDAVLRGLPADPPRPMYALDDGDG